MLTGAKLKALRAMAKMTQVELADAAGVSPNSIATFEAGTRDLRASTITKLFTAMKVKVTFRVGGTEIS